MSALLRYEAAPMIHLHPGQIFVTSAPAVVTTILGSCVAVCLWDPMQRVAGINHFLLPSTPLVSNQDARYGNTAMRRLIDDVLDHGAQRANLVARIAGGAAVLGNVVPKKPIGTQNVEVARQVLLDNGIQILAEATGGRRGRKIHFDTGTGGVRVKEL